MKNFTRNWKTTVAGVLTLAFAGLQVYQNPASLSDPQTIAAILGGAGLIAAKDGDKTGTVEQPK